MMTIKPELKRAIILTLRILGSMAVAVALFMPASFFDESMMFFGSILAGGACFIIAGRLEKAHKSELTLGPPKSGE